MSIRETLISARKAKALRARIDRNKEWSKQFIKRNGWIVITKEEQATCPKNARITNEERGKLEQFEIWRDKPDKFFAYVSFHDSGFKLGNPSNCTAENKRQTCNAIRQRDYVNVHVWTGERLGYGACGKPWRSNLGDLRVAVWVTIAGEDYSGVAYLSAGDYCRLTRRPRPGARHSD